MEMYSWCLVPRNASQEYKQAAYRAYTLAFGQAGTFEQDDFETGRRSPDLPSRRWSAASDFPYIMGMDSVRDP